jgi:hypothetical protein
VTASAEARLLSGIEVVVVAGSAEPTVNRLTVALGEQLRRPAAVRILPGTAGAVPDGLNGPVPHRAPWAVALDEGDDPTPGFLGALEAVLDGLDAPVALLRISDDAATIRIGTPLAVAGPVVDPGPDVRALWRPSERLAAALAALEQPGLTDTHTGTGARLVDLVLGHAVGTAMPGQSPVPATPVPVIEVPVIEVPVTVLRPLGRARSAAVPLPPALDDGPDVAVVTVDDWGGERWTVPELPPASWVALVDAAHAGAVLDPTFTAKAAVLARRGAGVLALVATQERLPRWQRATARPGDRVALLGFVAPGPVVAAFVAELAVRPVDDAVGSVLAGAAGHGPAGLMVRSFPIPTGTAEARVGEPGAVATGPVSAGRAVTVPSPVPAAIAVPCPAPSSVPVAPRATQVVELVADPVRRVLGLSSDLAPLDATTFPLRVPLGSIDRLPFRGTVAIHRRPSGSGGFVYSTTPAEGSVLVGHGSAVDLAEMPSLYDRWGDAVAVLRRVEGFVPWDRHTPEPLIGLFLHRAPGPFPRLDRVREFPTFVAGGPEPSVSGHPDLLALAARRGLPARVGPAVALEAGPNRLPVHGLAGLLGHGRAAGGPGDDAGPATGPGGSWWGEAAQPGRAVLVRWDCGGQQRCTLGEPPVRADGSHRDDRAVLIGTLGRVLEVGTEGGVPLFELHHRGRGCWLYSTDPASDARLGFSVVREVCRLLPVPNQETVSLYRSHDRRLGTYGVHLCPAEGCGHREALAGFVELAVGPRGAGEVPPVDVGGPVRTVQRCGDLPVVRMVSAVGEVRVTADVWRAWLEGMASTEVVGFVPGPEQDVLQRWNAVVDGPVPAVRRLAAQAVLQVRRGVALARPAIRGRR